MRVHLLYSTTIKTKLFALLKTNRLQSPGCGGRCSQHSVWWVGFSVPKLKMMLGLLNIDLAYISEIRTGQTGVIGLLIIL